MLEQTIVRPSRALAFVAVAAMLALATLWSAAETRAAQPLAGEFVGRVEGTNALIAVSTNGSQFVAYVCDGTDEGVSLYRWFQGDVRDGRVLLQDPGGLALSFDLRQGQINGQVAIGNGQIGNFGAATAFGESGLFQARVVTPAGVFVGGWIVIDLNASVNDDRTSNVRDDRASNVSGDFDLRGQVIFRPADNPADAQPKGAGSFDIGTDTAVIDGQSVMAKRITPDQVSSGDEY